jgi:predicted dehydrogenase
VKFVIVGLGSIGKRHQKNLNFLGHTTVICHKNDSLKLILDESQPDGVFICNPTSQHLATAMTVATAGYSMLLEKPISHNLEGIDELIQVVKQKDLVVQVGYNFRFEPELVSLKHKMAQIGQIKAVKIISSSYLPDWRPGTDYRQNYAAKKELGGGVLLDLSHEIDYAVWLFGKVKQVSAKLQKSEELDIETEAVADLTLEHESKVTSQVHLDYVTKGYIRNCQITGEKGKLRWDFAKIKNSDWDINEMYVDEVKHFIEAIMGKVKPMPTLEEGKHVLEICEASRKSSKTEKIVEL